ncbi:MAG: hypothetical protein WDW38_007085 [Sanguina aurantia]
MQDSDMGDVQLQPRSTAQAPPSHSAQQIAPGEAIKVTLHDCLACSGCITSAETVLLQHQSSDEFLAKLQDPAATVIVSVSPQSRAALAAFYNLPQLETLQRLSGWLKGLGVTAVLDDTLAHDISLLETAAEFISSYSSAPGMKCSAPLPMLASACPGWVCYAEKTHGELVLPHISSAKSPQAVMGTLIKRLCVQQWAEADTAHSGGSSSSSSSSSNGSSSSSRPATSKYVYHTSVMPCFDKKLEASREELTVPGSGEGQAAEPEVGGVVEVDSSLTTSEVQALLQSQGVDLRTAPLGMLDTLLPASMPAHLQHQHELHGSAGSSGGYLEFVLRAAAWELFGRVVPPGPLPMKALRNPDMQEVCLLDDDGGVLLRFAAAYGFRNIQMLMRKLKTKRCEYQYVEVMACPSGCLNGGGQIKAGPGVSPARLIEQLEQSYMQGVTPRHPAHSPLTSAVYTTIVGGGCFSPTAQDLFHTTYRKREKTVTSAIGDW